MWISLDQPRFGMCRMVARFISNTTAEQPPPLRRQSGVVLIVVALFLVVLAALGASSMRTANVQERVAGVFYDRATALGSSEAALSEGKEILLGPDFEATALSSKVRDGSSLYSSATGDGMTVFSWVQANTNWATGSYAGRLGDADGNLAPLQRVKIQPGYRTDRFPDMGISNTTKLQVFRVTGRGAGGRDENSVYTQILARLPVSTGF